MSVYFIACGGFIKVGFSADPEKRCKNLFQSTSRYSAPRASYEARAERTLIRSIAGTKATEYQIHQALEDFYAGCEWFVDEPQLRAWIADVEPRGRQPYPKLVRHDGPVDVPQGERGGGNAALAYSLLAKQQDPRPTADLELIARGA